MNTAIAMMPKPKPDTRCTKLARSEIAKTQITIVLIVLIVIMVLCL